MTDNFIKWHKSTNNKNKSLLRKDLNSSNKTMLSQYLKNQKTKILVINCQRP
jgi:hypothetical protein